MQIQILKHFRLQKREGRLYFSLSEFLANSYGHFGLEKRLVLSFAIVLTSSSLCQNEYEKPENVAVTRRH